MGQSSDQIRQEIDQKRADAAEKIDRIQGQVQDTSDQLRSQVTDTAEQVQETVQNVREQVQGTVEDSVETAKQAVENFDVHRHVQERPLVSVAAAFVGGIVLGKVMSGSGNGNGGHYAYQSQTASAPGHHQSGGIGNGVRSAVQQSGIDDLISNAAAALFGQVADQARTTIDRNFPGFTDKLQSVQKQEGSVMDKAKAAAQPDQGNV